MSPVSAADDVCPKCCKDSLRREWWFRSEFREQCSDCGYFHEETLDFSELGLEKLKALHFKTDQLPYVREGFFRQPAGAGKNHHISDLWFSMPTHGKSFSFEVTRDPRTKNRRLRKKVPSYELDIDWIDDPKPRGPGYPYKGRVL